MSAPPSPKTDHSTASHQRPTRSANGELSGDSPRRECTSAWPELVEGHSFALNCGGQLPCCDVVLMSRRVVGRRRRHLAGRFPQLSPVIGPPAVATSRPKRSTRARTRIRTSPISRWWRSPRGGPRAPAPPSRAPCRRRRASRSRVDAASRSRVEGRRERRSRIGQQRTNFRLRPPSRRRCAVLPACRWGWSWTAVSAGRSGRCR